jgi:hypothetical protein
VEAHRVVRSRGPQIFYTIGSQIAVMSALRADRPLFTPRKIPGTHFCQRPSRPRAIVRLEGLAHLKNPVASLGIEPATFRLVA